MARKKNMSMEQVYQLFSYKKNDLDFNDIFASLLFATVDLGADYFCATNSCNESGYVNFLIYTYPKLAAAKNNLPKYWDVTVAQCDILRVDAKLKLIADGKDRLKKIPWYCLLKLLHVYSYQRDLCEATVPLEHVFAYLKYRTTKAGMNEAELYNQFKEYAETFPEQLSE